MLCSQTLEGTLQRRLGQVCFMRHFTAVETGEFQIRVPSVKTSLVVCQQDIEYLRKPREYPLRVNKDRLVKF